MYASEMKGNIRQRMETKIREMCYTYVRIYILIRFRTKKKEKRRKRFEYFGKYPKSTIFSR